MIFCCLETYGVSLFVQESSACLEHNREGTSEANLHYKTQGAIYEAELMMRVLQQRKAAEEKQSAK